LRVCCAAAEWTEDWDARIEWTRREPEFIEVLSAWFEDSERLGVLVTALAWSKSLDETSEYRIDEVP